MAFSLHSVEARSQELAEAAFAHPFGAGEMSAVDAGGALRLAFGVKAEENRDNLLPIRTLGVGVKEADVQLDVRLVIGGQRGPAWRLVQKIVLGHSVPRARDVSILAGIVNADFTSFGVRAPNGGRRDDATAR